MQSMLKIKFLMSAIYHQSIRYVYYDDSLFSFYGLLWAPMFHHRVWSVIVVHTRLKRDRWSLTTVVTSRLAGVRLWAVITLQSLWWNIGAESRSWNKFSSLLAVFIQWTFAIMSRSRWKPNKGKSVWLAIVFGGQSQLFYGRLLARFTFTVWQSLVELHLLIFACEAWQYSRMQEGG